MGLIEQLRKGQGAPVHMIDELSKAMPEMLWLTELKQDGGDLTIDGRCTTLTALSDFVGNLERSGYFRRPVEILDSKVEAAAAPAARADQVHAEGHLCDARLGTGAAGVGAPAGRR